MNNAIDLSFSRLDVSALDGIDLVIQDLWTGGGQPGPRVENLRAASLAGKRIAGYMVVNPRYSNAAFARIGVPDDLWAALEFVAVDCELYNDLTAAKVRAESDALAALLPNRERVIYTVESYWRDVLGDDAGFGDHRLWDARPGRRPFRPYGAWTDERQVIGVQTSGTSNLGSMAVDFNEFSVPTGEIMSFSPTEKATINATIEALKVSLDGLNAAVQASTPSPVAAWLRAIRCGQDMAVLSVQVGAGGGSTP